MANRKLGRPTDQRMAMLRNQVTNLIWYGKIETTLARGKEVQSLAEHLVTIAMRQCDNTVEVTKKHMNDKQQVVELKEVQLSCRIDVHDFETKARNAVRFLSAGNKVRVVVRFKGREMTHQELGRDVLTRFEAAVAPTGIVEKRPVLDGRLMTMIVVPNKNQ